MKNLIILIVLLFPSQFMPSYSSGVVKLDDVIHPIDGRPLMVGTKLPIIVASDDIPIRQTVTCLFRKNILTAETLVSFVRRTIGQRLQRLHRDILRFCFIRQQVIYRLFELTI